MTLLQNFSFYVRLGAVNNVILSQMISQFGLRDRLGVMTRDLSSSEKSLAQLLIALTGSNKTLVLDDPFHDLPQPTIFKLVKIIEQKTDCTFIISSRSQGAIETL